MNLITKTTRRAVMAAQGACAVLLAWPGAARAASGRAVAPAARDTVTAEAPAAARWPSATAEELRPYLGARFRVRTATGETFAMRLTALESAASGPHRPAALSRREGVTAVYESPDIAPLVRAGCQVCRVSHPRIGTAELMLSASPRRSGGHVVELVLN